MLDEAFDQDAWLNRIGYEGRRTPTLTALQALVAAHSRAIAYESIDVLLDRPLTLDLASLQTKMILGRRGGYCFEQNMLFRAGLRSLGYKVTSLQARAVAGYCRNASKYDRRAGLKRQGERGDPAYQGQTCATPNG